MSQHANTKKHVSEHSWLSAQIILSILAHLACLTQFVFLILNGMNECFNTCLGMQIQEHVRELNWSSGWVILSILAHWAHLDPSYFFPIFSAFNSYNYSWFNLTNKEICSDWRRKHDKKWPMLMTFFLKAIAAIYW